MNFSWEHPEKLRTTHSNTLKFERKKLKERQQSIIIHTKRHTREGEQERDRERERKRETEAER